MKKTLLIVFLITITFDIIEAQNIPGVKQIAPYKKGISFIHRDAHKRLWLGYGSININGFASYEGLYYLDSSNTLVTKYPTGAFTDAIEWNNHTFITAYDGLYQVIKDSITRTPSMYNSTSITSFKDSLVIGSAGYGLYFWKDNHFKIQRIKIQNRYLDTIYDVVDKGDELWIATNSGLVTYKNGQFKLVNIPINPWINITYANRILSVARDKDDKIWYSNATVSDTVSNLFYIENNVIYDVKKEYLKRCISKDRIPYPIYNIKTARNGSILIGTYYGMVELSNDIKLFFTSKISDNLTYNIFSGNSSPCVGYEDVDGKYIQANRNGIFEIDRTIYSLEVYKDAILEKSPRTEVQIDINDIDANVSNDGILLNGPDLIRQLKNEKILGLRSIPNSCGNLMYTSSQWMSGKRQNDTSIYVAINHYRDFGSDQTPGPINISTLEYDSILSKQFNKIWVVYKKEIDDFLKNRLNTGYVIPQSILNWPANPLPNTHPELAPYVDADFNGKYEPIKGDYPKIKGDVMLWWVNNDITKKSSTLSKPMKIQVNVSCYAYNDLRIDVSNPDFLANRTLLFDLKYINLSGYDYVDFNAGILSDIDLGDYSDDAVGCDSSINLGFGYNSKNNDFIYGNNPPIIACKFLNQPMSHFIAYTNSFYFKNDALGYYSLSRSTVYSGNNIFQKMQNFNFPQYPCQNTQSGSYSDKRFIMTSDIGELKKNASVNLEMAYFVQYDPTKDYLKEHCDELKSNANKIQNWYNTNSFPSKSYWSTELTDIKDITLEVYPNPSTGLYKAVASSDIHVVKVFDVLGNMIFTQNVNGIEAVINLQTYNSGIYILHVETAAGTLVKKLVKS